MANMSDRTNIVATTMNFWLNAGAALTALTQPFKLRLMSAQGSNTANGTEMTGSNFPGYTAGGNSMGSPAFGANSAGVSASSNAVSWTATGTQTAAIVAVEVWDTQATPKRALQGAITSINGLVNGNTLTFAAGAVTADASAW